MYIKQLSKFFPKLDINNAGKDCREGEIIWSWFEYAVFYKRTRYFQQVLDTIDLVINHEKCTNALEKMNEIGNFRNVDAFLSECKFVQQYLEAGYSVDYILDNDTRFTGRKPDFIVWKNSNFAWIEVRTAGEIDRLGSILIEDLRTICPLLKKPYVMIRFTVDYEYKDIWKDIDSLIKLVKYATSKFHGMIKKSDYHLPPGKYKCGIVTYEVIPYSENRSIVLGGGPEDVFEIPIKPLEKLINKIIGEKSKKSMQWDKKIPYYVGVDFQETFYDEDSFVNVLYGETKSWSREFLNIPDWKFDDSLFPEVETAIERGWNKDFLKSQYLIPHGLTRMENKGLFFTNPDSKEISGFLSLFRVGGNKLYVYPNPFAKKEREYRNYEWLGVLP